MKCGECKSFSAGTCKAFEIPRRADQEACNTKRAKPRKTGPVQEKML